MPTLLYANAIVWQRGTAGCASVHAFVWRDLRMARLENVALLLLDPEAWVHAYAYDDLHT